MNNTFSKYWEKIKTPKFLIIIGVVGILLIFLSGFGGESKKSEKEALNPEITAEEYREQLEKDIKKIVKNITGSNKVTVVVTLESGIRYKYADIHEGSSADKTENDTVTTSSESKEGYITVKTADGGEQALLVTTQMPEVRGVAIVCTGGDNETVAEKIENTVTAALNITSKRVHIAGGN
jgi:stage III sporulation protein AG